MLYGDTGEKPRRELRQYLDAAGREVYQEYFAPRSQRKYSEEIYRYDDGGNLVHQEWRRLDGRARRETRYEVLETDAHGRWTERLVHVDGEPFALDRRTIEDGAGTMPRPPASAGPVEPSAEILPVPFAPGVVATRGAGENGPSFGPDGREVVFTRYGDEWTEQSAFLSTWRDGAWREAEALPLPTPLYNAALAEDGESIVYCRRDDSLEGGRVFLAERTEDGWSEPVDLSERDALYGSYFRLLGDGTLYFHRGGDLFRCVLTGEGAGPATALRSPINTPDGVEFGAWVDAAEELLLFTRSVEGAPERSGVFSTRRSAAGWGEPRRLPVPYGWSPVLSPDGEDLVYVVDGDVCRVPVVLLDIR